MEGHGLTRGDIVIVALAGDYGKSRPAVVVQSDLLDGVDSVILCPMTSDLRGADSFRIVVAPTTANGLRQRSAIMTDKLMAIPRRKIDASVGRLDDAGMDALNAALAFVLGLVA